MFLAFVCLLFYITKYYNTIFIYPRYPFHSQITVLLHGTVQIQLLYRLSFSFYDSPVLEEEQSSKTVFLVLQSVSYQRLRKSN